MSFKDSGYFVLLEDKQLGYIKTQPNNDKVISWKYTPWNRKNVCSFILEAAILKANIKQINLLLDKWQITNEDYKEFSKRSNIILENKFNKWTAKFKGNDNSKVLPRKTAFEALVKLGTRYPELLKNSIEM